MILAQNTQHTQEFVRVAKILAGVVDLKGVRGDASRVAGARISCSVMSMFGASGAGSVEGLQITEILFCRDRFAWQLQEFVCLGLTFSWQAQYF